MPHYDAQTRAEAARTWCHKFPTRTGPDSRCLGPDCQAWRWSDERNEFTWAASGERPRGPSWRQVRGDASGATYARPRGAGRRGFCVLVGAP